NVMRHQLAVGRKVTICGPKGIAKNVQAKLLAYNWILLEADEHAVSYEIREISDNQQIDVYELRATRWELHLINSFQSNIVYDNGIFQAKYTLLDHKVSTVAYLFQAPEKIKMNMQNCPYPAGAWIQKAKQRRLEIADNEIDTLTETLEIQGLEVPLTTLFSYLQKETGYRLGFIMDHQANEENHAKIRALFYEADEVFIESYYADNEKYMAFLNHHSTAKASATVMKQAKVKKAIPIHFSRRYHDEISLKMIQSEFFEAFAQ
ncbi:MAG: peptidase, partial [Bacteroidia bacterium]